MSDTDEGTGVLGFPSVKALLEFNRSIIAEFRANGGVCGGPFEGNPMILLTMTGAKSGRELTTPLTYCPDGDNDDACIIFASAGGAPKHPNWYHNLMANQNVTIERGTETYTAKAVFTAGADRQAAFERMAQAMPRFAEYQEKTEREIPVIRLVRKG